MTQTVADILYFTELCITSDLPPRKVAQGWQIIFRADVYLRSTPCLRKVSPAWRKVRKDYGDHTSKKSHLFLQTFRTLYASNLSPIRAAPQPDYDTISWAPPGWRRSRKASRKACARHLRKVGPAMVLRLEGLDHGRLWLAMVAQGLRKIAQGLGLGLFSGLHRNQMM